MHRSSPRWTANVIAALATGLAATCSAAGGTKNIDACRLITATEASTILGTKITVDTADPSDPSRAGGMCHFKGPGINGGFMLQAGRVHYKNAAKEVAEQEEGMVKSTPPGLPVPSFTSIEGLGDAAYLAKTSAYFQLHVLAHGSAVVINRNVVASAKAVEQAKQLAQAAIARLK